jgi:DNA-3-methyladenine glycosylase
MQSGRSSLSSRSEARPAAEIRLECRPAPDLREAAVEVAPRLLGCLLVRRLPRGGLLVGRIVETEAYPGGADTASHSAGGRRTARNESMWREGGHLYVYFTYGMHWCVNLVTGPEGSGEAVLVRAVEPLVGIDAMRRNRPGRCDRDLARGPARFCRAFGIDGRMDGIRIDAPGSTVALWGPPVGSGRVRIDRGPRIGIERHGVWARRRWRFWVAGSRFVSG